MPATRNLRRVRYEYSPLGMSDSVGGSMGTSTGDGLGDELGFNENGYRDLLSHVPNTTQSFAIPALVLLPASATPLAETVPPLWPVSSDALRSGMRPPTAAPVTTLRTRTARAVAKSPYSRANTTTKFDPALDEVIKNCPAVDVLLGGYATPRSSTHSRGRNHEHVSRPPNAFMVYRSYVWFTKQLDNSTEKNLSCVSKLAAESWKDMSAHARAPFHEVAALAKRKHADLHPNYKYAPSSRSEKPTKKKNVPPPTPKAREKAKAVATPTNDRTVAVASPLPRRATQAARRSSDALASVVVPTSPVPSASTSTASSSSASPPPTPDLEYPYPTPFSPELGYPCDIDLPGFPSRPRFRAVSPGCIPSCIPSPAISVLELNVHESLLDSLPDKYEEAASYHDLTPHALPLQLRVPPFDGVDPNGQIVAPPPCQSIDYSCYISGNPDAKLVAPAASSVDHPDAPPLGGCAFSLDPCADIADHTFHSSPSLFDWVNFDTLTLGPGPIADDTAIYIQGDGQGFDPVIASGIY
ncbi:hypothetical protein EDB83DRAFT_2351859 [Lactarius deliciosus]|nr:hypothetical protein EDB83DRAFT_2351859 [Lactarius deliciosus]